jgi:hypothetical protein
LASHRSRQLVGAAQQRVAGAAAAFSSESDEPTGGKWKTFGGIDSYTAPKYRIQTFNKISSLGLARFPGDRYDVLKQPPEGAAAGPQSSAPSAHAILLRSYKLKEEEVAPSVQVREKKQSWRDWSFGCAGDRPRLASRDGREVVRKARTKIHCRCIGCTSSADSTLRTFVVARRSPGAGPGPTTSPSAA